MKVVFTSLHGTGGQLVPQALKRRGFVNVFEVAEQAAPDGEFPTVKSPNPEEPAARNTATQGLTRQLPKRPLPGPWR